MFSQHAARAATSVGWSRYAVPTSAKVNFYPISSDVLAVHQSPTIILKSEGSRSKEARTSRTRAPEAEAPVAAGGGRSLLKKVARASILRRISQTKKQKKNAENHIVSGKRVCGKRERGGRTCSHWISPLGSQRTAGASALTPPPRARGRPRGKHKK